MDEMTIAEAKRAIKRHILVGTHDVGGACLYSTGYLLQEVKGKKEKEFFFKDRHGEIEITRPASVFNFAN